jgi:hypothetical protein
MKDLRKDILELADISSKCPQNLQQVCFELLLKNYLAIAETHKPPQEDKKSKGELPLKPEIPPPKLEPTKDSKSQKELVKASLHVKTLRFMEKQSVTIEEINNLYYKEGDSILPLFEDLKTTRTSESQIRVVLLQCLKNALVSGDFQCQIEDARAECNDRKCYDVNNWTNNFSNNAALFDFNKWAKGITQVKLSEKGKEELSAVIKELQ